jgi:hypothetical protein
MAPTSTSVDGLEAMEKGTHEISGAPQARRGIAAQDVEQTAGRSDGPWRLANSPAVKFALSNAFFASLGLPKLTAHG